MRTNQEHALEWKSPRRKTALPGPAAPHLPQKAATGKLI
jgi:hypothetical protein